MSQLAKTLLTTFFTLFTTTLWAVSDSIVISSAADWEEFALRVNSGETGLTGTLAADITVSTMVGTAEHQFEGSFDGQGYTLDISISDSTDAYTAPFHYIHNAHIHHLKVTGSVTHTDSTLTYCHHMSGLVGVAYGENIINDCVVSATISGGDYLSGFLGHGTTSLTTISNCIFNGQILGHSDDAPIGVFCAWADTTTVVICNCLEIGTAYTGNVSSVGCHVSESCAGVYYTAIQGDLADAYTGNGAYPVYPTPQETLCEKVFSFDDINYFTYGTTEISGIEASYTYTGDTIAITPTVVYNGIPLEERQYAISFARGDTPVEAVIEPGDYTMTVSGDTITFFGSNSVCFVVEEPPTPIILQIGEATESSNILPTNSFFNYSLSQQIYYPDEIGLSGDISSLAFFNTESERERVIDVYLVNTGKATFSSETDWVNVKETDKVFSGNVTFIENDWTVINFDQSFTYDADSCLAIIFDDNTGSYSTGLSCSVFPAEGQTLRINSDGTDYDPIFPDDSEGNIIDQKNVIRLGIIPTAEPTFRAPANLTVSHITKNNANVNWESEAGLWNLRYKISGDDDWTEEVGLTDNTYTLTNLTAGATYTVCVQTDNGIGRTSRWVTTDFTTLDALPKPTDLTCTAFTDSTAVLTWTENDHSTMWEIEYTTDNTFENDVLTVTVDTVTTATLTKLIPETTYFIRVRAVNEDGDQSQWSDVCRIDVTAKIVIGQGEKTSGILPTDCNYKNSLSQQIYTADEIKQPGLILSIDYFIKGGSAVVRDLDIYMTHTDKNKFEDKSQWIPVVANELVFSGRVIFEADQWTTITLDEPFFYDGDNNMVITVSDHSGTYEAQNPSFLTLNADSMALCHFRDNGNYDPTVSPDEGHLLNNKNQIRLLMGEPPACKKPRELSVNLVTPDSAIVCWKSEGCGWNVRYKAEGTTDWKMVAVSDTTYTIKELVLGTTYEVQVQTDCGEDATSDWSKPVSFTTPFCAEEDQCVITYKLTDSFGDGWNNCAINVLDAETGILLATWTINDGDSASGALAVCNGRDINFEWVSGNFPSECSYEVYDVNEELIFSGTDELVTVNYTVCCTINNCKKPKDVTASTPLERQVVLSWTPGSEDQTTWDIAYKADDEEEFTILHEVIDNPYTLTGLNPETVYSVKVRGNCGEDDYSSWSEAYTFTTMEENPAAIILGVITTQTTATISWTGESDSYKVRYRIPAHSGYTFFDDFENGLDRWTTIRNGEGTVNTDWHLTNPAEELTNTSLTAKSGSQVAISRSWATTSYMVDNWLITPKVQLGGTLKYWVVDDDIFHEHYDIYVSTATNAIEDFQLLSAPGDASGTWEEVSVDLSEYENAEGYIALRHQDIDQNFLLIDDFGIYSGEMYPAGEWTEVTIDETSLEITGLTPNTEYEYQIIGIKNEEENGGTAVGMFSTLDEGDKAFVTAGDWNNPENWIPTGVPTRQDNVVVYQDVSIPSGVTAEAKYITLSGGTITIKDGGQIRQSSSGLTVTIEKDIVGYGERNDAGHYYFITPPIKETAYSTEVDSLLEGDYDYYRFNSTHELEWINYDNVETRFNMAAGNGYLYANKENKTLRWTGSIWKNEDMAMTLTLNYNEESTDAFKGWFLLGNPYASNVYIAAIDDANNVLDVDFYRMNKNGDGYDVYNKAIALRPCEGAFVEINQKCKIYILIDNEDYISRLTPSRCAVIPFLPGHDLTDDQDAYMQIALQDAADNEQIINEYAGRRTDVTLDGRTLYKDGYWNTLCLPFNVKLQESPLAGAEVRTLSNVSVDEQKMTLTFGRPVNKLEAGTPYIIKWTHKTRDEGRNNDLINPTFTGVIISATQPTDIAIGPMSFKGNYSPVAIEEENERLFFLGGENKLYHPNGTMGINAFRSYFFLEEDNSEVSRFTINFEDDTDIISLPLSTAEAENDAWYTIDGRKLSNKPTVKGVYIHQNRQVIVK